jgi:transposase InsO family protein
MIFKFIDDHRREFRIDLMCRVLGVSRSGYYAHLRRPTSARKVANEVLWGHVRGVFEESGRTYGSPRVHRVLQKRALVCSEKRVAQLMRLGGLRAKGVKRMRARISEQRLQTTAPNLLQGDFTASELNTKWLSDMTYIRTRQGWLYLAAVLDLCSRRVVGWAMSSRMVSELPEQALKMALVQRVPDTALVHHSDQGSQYRSTSYQRLLRDHNIQVSMNGVGAWSDNAPMESFFATLKRECVDDRLYSTRAEARTALFAYIEGFYNRRRLHSSLGYQSPEEFECVCRGCSVPR